MDVKQEENDDAVILEPYLVSMIYNSILAELHAYSSLLYIPVVVRSSLESNHKGIILVI